MLSWLLVYVALGVLLIPVQSQLVTVCIEDDNELRVDCKIEPTINKINSYEFSWSQGTKEFIINTNVSGSSPDSQFSGKSQVVELEPHGYRMTLSGFTDTLPHNTTYMCKITGQIQSVNVERENLLPCSAVSVFLRSSWSWIMLLLVLLCHRYN